MDKEFQAQLSLSDLTLSGSCYRVCFWELELIDLSSSKVANPFFWL